MLTAIQIASLCDHVDDCRAEGMSYEGILSKLVASDRGNQLEGITEAHLRQWHAASQKEKFSAETSRQRTLTPIGEMEFAAPETASHMESDGKTITVSEAAAELVTYLGKDLLAGRPTWQFACYRRLAEGEILETIKGPGETAQAKWIKSAVIIRRLNTDGSFSLVDCYPEHRVRIKKTPKGARLEILTLSNTSSAKVCQKLLEIEVELGTNPPPRRKLQLQQRRQNLERRVNTGKDRSGVTVLKIQQIISRLAAVIDIHCPDLTGIGGIGAKLARATGRTRAAQSAARIKIEKELATGSHRAATTQPNP